MIFNRVKERNFERLQSVLVSDKQFSPEKVQRVLKCDIYNLLSNYCTISPNDLKVNVNVQKDGSYKFEILATSNRLKIFGSLPDDYS